jgi:hypothetical protein
VNATARRVFRPFRYAGRQGQLVLESLLVDGVPVPVPEGAELVELQDARPRSTLQGVARFELPAAVWETLPEEERRPEALRVILVAEEEASWVRETVPMTPGPDGAYRGRVALSAADLRDAVELHCVVARASARASSSGRWATELAARLCTSPALRIRLTEPEAAPGSFMSVRWQAFSELEPLRAWLGHPGTCSSPPTRRSCG